MADAIKRSTLQHYASIDTTGFDPVEWLIFGTDRANEIPVLRALYQLVPARHLKIVNENVVEMLQSEKDAVDALLLNFQRDSIANFIENTQSYERAFAEILLDDRNMLATKIKLILDAIDGASTLAQVKSAVQVITDPPQFTLANFKTALRNKLEE